MVLLLTNWVKNIIFVVLFASFLELLLPNSSMQRFVRVIMGLFIMLAILSPVIDVVQNRIMPIQVPVLSGNPGNSVFILNDAQKFLHGREELATQLYKKELAQQIQVLITALEGVADARVVVEIDTNNREVKGRIRSVVVYITPGIAGNNTQIKQVVIGEEGRLTTGLNPELKNKVEKLLTELYQLPKDIITVKKIHS